MNINEAEDIIKLYPLKFKPQIKERIWGGKRLRDVLHKDVCAGVKAGESWELSAVPGSVSVVANGELAGRDLSGIISEYKACLLGHSVYDRFGENFPLLIKFIDAEDNLSVQVHPDDDIARKFHGGFGKTEMWYVMDSEPDAKLISGFSRKTDETDFRKCLNNGSLTELMAEHTVKRGDTFFIPAGRIHAIGKGIMLAEIQQSSDLTYRIYDYDRVDSNGLKRELHIDLGTKALNFNDVESGYVNNDNDEGGFTHIVDSKYFKTNIINIPAICKRNYSDIDSFVILICVDGATVIVAEGKEYHLSYGETILIPASVDSIEFISGNARLLETHL